MREPAPYASDPEKSPGRHISEPASRWRSDFQRDRDRIIHATSFRRLKGKTQVFLAGEGDHYRTRLTHTLEVAQIARSLARALELNEDLTEAVALAHDLGHPPVGHSGERALDKAMAAFGGFDHNIQSLRVVTGLEHRYPSFDGLNLTWDVLEGLAKHNGPLADAEGTLLSGRQFPPVIVALDDWHDLALASFPSAEAQCAAIADDIAYNAHDIDDGFRAGLLNVEKMRSLPPLARLADGIDADHPGLELDRFVPELVRRLINWMVEDVLSEARRRLDRTKANTTSDIRASQSAMVSFSTSANGDVVEIKRFLNAKLYSHPSVTEVMEKAEALVTDLFGRYWADEAAIPPAWRAEPIDDGGNHRARQIADFLAGMTDRFALAEYRRLFDRVADFG